MLCLSFFQQPYSNGQTLKSFDINKYTCNSLKGCVLEVDLEYFEELQELYNDHPLARDKIKIKKRDVA